MPVMPLHHKKHENYNGHEMQNIIQDNDEDQNDTLISDWVESMSINNDQGLTNRYHRTTSIHRNIYYGEPSEADLSRTLPRMLEDRRKWMTSAGTKRKRTRVELEEHANNIVSHMEQDTVLMEDSHESEQLRREALRDMPQCLTVKRIIKRKLNKSVLENTKTQKPISLWKNLKYRLSIKATKMQNSLKSLAYSFELWYSSLKMIEGRFGSGVATHFKFFRWLFIMNCLITFFICVFIVIPQLLYVHIEPVTPKSNANPIIYDTAKGDGNMSTIVPESLIWKTRRGFENDVPFGFFDLFTGEGSFVNTLLYYGYYTNERVQLITNYSYHMPFAYFFTMCFMYIVSFIVISISMARSYRRSFIETQGGLKNVYAHKIFCGWDYSIATEEVADLKSSSIYHELKEILNDSKRDSENISCWQQFWTCTVQVSVNCLMVVKLFGVGYGLWYLLESNSADNAGKRSVDVGIITAITINVFMMAFPAIFALIIRYEDYKHPRAALYVTLIRTFLLKSVIIGVFLGFWLTHSTNNECWETSIGQHVYRLILFDFLFSVVIGTLIQIIRYFVYKRCWRKIGASEFDIAKNTLQLMYNQTLFWTGLFFSPLLALVVIIKLWCTWYICRTFLLMFSKTSSKSWRAAQTHTWFLILSFLSLLLVIIAHGYIIVNVRTSKCGPFQNYRYMYEMITKGVFQLEKNSAFWRMLLYLAKPGTVALILVAMCVIVYYLRAKAFAQKSMVNILREMLILEAKDKEFLLENISKITEGKWQYHLGDRNGRLSQTIPEPVFDPFLNLASMGVHKDFGDSDTSGAKATN